MYLKLKLKINFARGKYAILITDHPGSPKIFFALGPLKFDLDPAAPQTRG